MNKNRSPHRLLEDKLKVNILFFVNCFIMINMFRNIYRNVSMLWPLLKYAYSFIASNIVIVVLYL